MSNMNIQNALKHAAEKIRSGLLTTEAQVGQAVIIPTLSALGWDYANPAEFLPQYPVPDDSGGRGWVDFALLGAGGHPLVFIETKRLGGLSVAGESQLFDYANGRGIPILVLTDGNTWDFYLSMAAGVPAQRRFYRAELQREEGVSEFARHFGLYLRKDMVLSEKARIEAEKFHESNRGREEAKRVMPEVWQTLLQEPDEMLRDLLVEAVESKCGTKPELDDAGDFLAKQADGFQARVSSGAPVNVPSPKKVSEPAIITTDGGGKKRIVGYVLQGQRVETGVGNRTLAELLKELHRRDPEFMPKYAFATRGRTRRLVAKNRDDLYNEKDLLDFSQQLEDGWWLGTNLSNVDIKKRIRIACAVAGIRLGADLQIIER